MACVPVERTASSLFASRTCETRRSTCRCPAAIIPRQLILIPNLVLFWSGRYKGMDEGQPYVLSPHIWQAVGTTSAAATGTIPSSFGTSIPNPATDCSYFTSSTWSVWSLFIAPTVLRGRFPEDCYYKHFCSLVRILNLCLQFEISEEDINEIELGIRKWVVEYERCVCPFRFRRNEG